MPSDLRDKACVGVWGGGVSGAPRVDGSGGGVQGRGAHGPLMLPRFSVSFRAFMSITADDIAMC